MQKIRYKGQELLPVKADIVFKAIFAKEANKDLLASFISSILSIDIASQDITITNTELSPFHEDGKLSRLDIRIKTVDHSHMDVEIQLRNEHNIEKRSIYYLSRLYIEQMVSGMTYSQIGRTIAINILDYNFLNFEDYHNCYRLKNRKVGHELTDVFEINFIELPKVPESKNRKYEGSMEFIFVYGKGGGVGDVSSEKSSLPQGSG